MTNEYWIFAIVTFLFALSVKKYIDLDSLRESIENYLAEVSPEQTIEEEDLVELEEIRDMIEDFVVRNPEIFSRINIKDE